MGRRNVMYTARGPVTVICFPLHAALRFTRLGRIFTFYHEISKYRPTTDRRIFIT